MTRTGACPKKQAQLLLVQSLSMLPPLALPPPMLSILL
jgi:hypothetical protein